MRLSQVHFLVFAFIVFSFITCKEKKENVNYISHEMKNFTVFKEGSWWLYKNLKTNLADTWKVMELNQGITGTSHDPIKFEQIVMVISSYTFGTFKIISEPGSAYFFTNKSMGLSEDCFFDNNSNIGYTCVNHSIRLLNTDSLDGICIKKEFDLYPNTCSNYFPKYYSWKRNIGLIGIAFNDGDTLILKDKFIQQ